MGIATSIIFSYWNGTKEKDVTKAQKTFAQEDFNENNTESNTENGMENSSQGESSDTAQGMDNEDTEETVNNYSQDISIDMEEEIVFSEWNSIMPFINPPIA